MPIEYTIQAYAYEDEEEATSGAFTPYGTVKEFFEYQGAEVIISGPYDSGKTLAMMHKLNLLMWLYPGARALLVRKSYKALLPSALETYYSKVLPIPPTHPDSRVHVYGGGVPQWIDYDKVNGKSSRIVLGGMDVPEKVLSSEYDFIAVPQAEELTQHDWEQLLGRCSGRAGNAPFHQLMGDCNPDTPSHWILHRSSLKLFHAKHTDNPTLYQRKRNGELAEDENKNPIPTDGGRGRIEILKSLTGLRYKRGFLGLWVGAEGQVYEEFDPAIHIIDQFEIPEDWRRYRCIDFGFTHPFVCQWWAEDEDGRLYMYREIYMSKRTVAAHMMGIGEAPGIIDLSANEKYYATICDWDAEDRATMAEHGINTVAADKRIQVGIEKFQERLKPSGDGRPRIFFMRDSLVEVDETLKDVYQPVRTTEEFPGYIWRDMSNRREQTSKDEVPMRVADHGMDAARYMVMYLDGGGSGIVKVTRYA